MRPSYATGNVVTENSSGNRVGGLVGNQVTSFGVIASYATGETSGSFGARGGTGALVGFRGRLPSDIRESYGFGEVRHGDRRTASDGSPRPDEVGMPSQLTAENAGDAWDAAVAQTPTLSTLGAWDFGTASQPPALRFADYDGGGPLFDCSQFPAGACGTLLPGQDVLRVEGPAFLESGGAGRLSGSLEYGRYAISSWSWQQLQGPTAALRGADQRTLNFTVPVVSEPLVLVFRLTAATSDGYEYNKLFTITAVSSPADDDGDGLVEIAARPSWTTSATTWPELATQAVLYH